MGDTIVKCGTCNKEYTKITYAAACCPRLIGEYNGVATLLSDVILSQPIEYITVNISTDSKENSCN